jgi:Calcineurin-like phosphoesterase
MPFLTDTWVSRSVFVLVALGLQLTAQAQIPVTNRPVNDSAGDFRFAILPDRNGGMRPGVFEDAVAKIKLIQPAFVMSTGDLIDGYTTDPKVWNAQWQEFESIVEKLEMPFYYVPGNHDISNLLLLDAWKQRRGNPWFSFVYKNVLFVCLHTEDRPFGGLGAKQIAWAKKTLAEHPDVRWTLLFFHRPLWMEKNQAGYEQVQATLKGRNYTVFSGHLHHYVQGERDGMKHYALATVGGDSKVRGKEVGEFDHITWVTMKSGGPVVANLALGGIVPEDIVTEEMLPRVDALREGGWLQVEPVVHDTPEFNNLTVPLRLANPTDFPLHVQGELKPVAGIHFDPALIDLIVAPNQTETLPLNLLADASAVSIHSVNKAGLNITLVGGYRLKEKEVALPATQAVQLDWKHLAPHADQPVNIDGNLVEWPADTFTTVTRPMFIKENWDWHGSDDGHIRFAVQHRDGKIFVAVETFDDRVISVPNPAELQDKLYVQIKTANGVIDLEGLAGTATTSAAVQKTTTGLTGEFSATFPPGEKSFHLNVGWMDHDRPENTKPSVLWWRDPAVSDFGAFTLAP